MTDRDPNLVTSRLSRLFTQDGITVDLVIYKLEGGADRTLEVVNDKGTSTVWNDPFAFNDAANATFLQAVADDGITTFLNLAVVIPFRR
ncbi:hypothetical protein C8J24_3051 [Sphingomonas aerolata]|uniref:Uncharacterized protein n=1 Tax=Sphingomonas aerolata TaxID=185951 RepID=A0A2T4YN59_9SPHN|nr:hypothetical protein [Sphingomonas aerolata]PTM44839.1 hypothetical protein C8J24_3051 [Sphingomonas aerolata]